MNEAVQLEQLVGRAADLVWAGTYPAVVRHALQFRRRDVELQAICGTLSEPEQYAIGWLDDLDPEPADGEVACSEDAAILGWAAGRYGDHALRALLERCDAYRTTIIVAAAFHDRGMPAGCRDLVEPPDESLETTVAVRTYYPLDIDSEDWAKHLAQALMAQDCEAAIDRVLDAVHELARRRLADFETTAIRPDPDEACARLARAVARVCPRDSEFMGRMRSIASAAKAVARVGRGAQVVAQLADLYSRFGSPASWGPRWAFYGFDLACASGDLDEARRLDPEPSASRHAQLVGAHVHAASETELRAELRRLLARDPVVYSRNNLPTRLLSPFDARAFDRLTAADLVELAPALFRLDPAARPRVFARWTARRESLSVTNDR